MTVSELDTEEGVIADKWKDVETSINEYKRKIGCISKAPDNIIKTLELSPNEFLKLSADECGEKSFLLSQYSIYLQQEYNFYRSKLDWCENVISYFVITIDPSCSTFINKELIHFKALKISTYNIPMKKLLKMYSDVKIIATNLYGLSEKVDKLSYTYLNLQQNKRRQ